VPPVGLPRQWIADDGNLPEVRNQRPSRCDGILHRHPQRASRHIRRELQLGECAVVDAGKDDRHLHAELCPQGHCELQRLGADGNDGSNRCFPIFLLDEVEQQPLVFRSFEMAELQLLGIEGDRRRRALFQNRPKRCDKPAEIFRVRNGLVQQKDRAWQRLRRCGAHPPPIGGRQKQRQCDNAQHCPHSDHRRRSRKRRAKLLGPAAPTVAVAASRR
jgi:hypothetical protein